MEPKTYYITDSAPVHFLQFIFVNVCSCCSHEKDIIICSDQITKQPMNYKIITLNNQHVLFIEHLLNIDHFILI